MIRFAVIEIKTFSGTLGLRVISGFDVLGQSGSCIFAGFYDIMAVYSAILLYSNLKCVTSPDCLAPLEYKVISGFDVFDKSSS